MAHCGNHRDFRSCDRSCQPFVVERRKILGRAASAGDDDDVDVVVLVEVTHSRGYLMRCTFSLHLRRINEHIHGMMPAFENVENVSQRSRLR